MQLLQKVYIASSYLELDQFLWYKGLCSCRALVTWSIFTEEMIAHYEDTKSNTFFSQLINLKQKGSMAKHIKDFKKLNIRVNDILENKMIDVFGNLNYGSVFSPSLPQPTKFTSQQLEEKREKGLCYNCDRKYTKG